MRLRAPRWLLVWLGLFTAIVIARREILWLPPYEDQACGVFAEADYLVEHHYNYWKLRYEEKHFTDAERGVRSYYVTVLPALLGAGMMWAPSSRAFFLIGHLVTVALSAGITTLVFEALLWRVGAVLAALAAGALLTTPLFVVQTDMIGMDIPMTIFAVGAGLLTAQGKLGLAACLHTLTFLMKPTGTIFPAAAAICLFASYLAGRWGELGLSPRRLLVGAILTGLLFLTVFELFHWADPLPDRAEFIRPRLVTLPYALVQCPEVGFALALAATLTLAHAIVRTAHWGAQARESPVSNPDRAWWVGPSRLWDALLPEPALVLYGWLVIAATAAAIVKWFFMPRYLTSILPFLFFILAIAAHRSLRPRWLAHLLFIGMIGWNLSNRSGRWLPHTLDLDPEAFARMSIWHSRSCIFTERSLEYLADHRAALEAMSLLARDYANHPIFSEIPYAWYLQKHRLGYVPRPLPQVYFASHFDRTVQWFRDAVLAAQRGEGEFPIFVYTGRVRSKLPAPNDREFEMLFDDRGRPPLLVYRVKAEALPATAREIEDWFLDHTWAEEFMAQRALERSEFLLRSGRIDRSIAEHEQAIDQGEPFFDPFLRRRLADLRAARDRMALWSLVAPPGASVTLAPEPYRDAARLVASTGAPAGVALLVQIGSLQAGDFYRICLRAKAASPTSLSARIAGANGGVQGHLLADQAPIGPEDRALCFGFLAEGNWEHAALVLEVAEGAREIEVADVLLERNPWLLALSGGASAEQKQGDPGAESVDVTIHAIGSGSPFGVQLSRSPFTVAKGAKYRLRFEAKASQERPMLVSVTQSSPPFRNLGLYQVVDLAPQWRAFDMEWTASDADAMAGLYFNLGEAPATVSLRAVRWE